MKPASNESSFDAEKELAQISQNLCGVEIGGEVTLDMVYHFVEGEIEKQSDLRDKAEKERNEFKDMAEKFYNASKNDFSRDKWNTLYDAYEALIKGPKTLIKNDTVS